MFYFTLNIFLSFAKKNFSRRRNILGKERMSGEIWSIPQSHDITLDLKSDYLSTCTSDQSKKRCFKYIRFLGHGAYGAAVLCREDPLAKKKISKSGKQKQLMCMKVSIADDSFKSECAILSILTDQLIMKGRCQNFCKYLYSFETNNRLPNEGTNYSWKFLSDISCLGRKKPRRENYGCILTEYVSGGRLGKYIKNNTLSVERWLSFSFQLIYGLHCMRHGVELRGAKLCILHRDISVKNVLLEPLNQPFKTNNRYNNDLQIIINKRDGSQTIYDPCRIQGHATTKFMLKWIDFGLSEIIHASEMYDNIKCDRAVVSLLTRPPELFFFTNDHLYYNCQSDIWSLGCVILGMAVSGFTGHSHALGIFNIQSLYPEMHKVLNSAITNIISLKNEQIGEKSNYLRQMWLNIDITFDVESSNQVTEYIWNMLIIMGGLPTDESWPGVEHTLLWKVLHSIINQYPDCVESTKDTIGSIRRYLLRTIGEEALQLIASMMQWDPSGRPTTQQLLENPVFNRLVARFPKKPQNGDVDVADTLTESPNSLIFEDELIQCLSQKRKTSPNKNLSQTTQCWEIPAVEDDRNTDYGCIRKWKSYHPIFESCIFSYCDISVNPVPSFQEPEKHFFWCINCETLSHIRKKKAFEGDDEQEGFRCCN